MIFHGQQQKIFKKICGLPWKNGFETLVFAELWQQSDHLNARVMIRASAKGTGRITIHFSNNEQLENLIEKLRE